MRAAQVNLRGMSDTFLTVSAVAGRLALDVQTVRRYITTGKLPAHRFGRDWRIDPTDLATFLDATRVVGGQRG